MVKSNDGVAEGAEMGYNRNFRYTSKLATYFSLALETNVNQDPEKTVVEEYRCLCLVLPENVPKSKNITPKISTSPITWVTTKIQDSATTGNSTVYPIRSVASDTSPNSHIPVAWISGVGIVIIFCIGIGIFVFRRRHHIFDKSIGNQVGTSDTQILRPESPSPEFEQNTSEPVDDDLREINLTILNAVLEELREGRTILDNGAHQMEIGNSASQTPRNRLLINNHGVIGKGYFGSVYQGTLIKSSEDPHDQISIDVPIKVLNEATEEYVRIMVNEIKVMSSLRSHSNIVEFLGIFQNPRNRKLFCVMELCANKNLRQYLISIKPKQEMDLEIVSHNYFQFRKSMATVTLPNKLFRQLLGFSLEIATGMKFLTDQKVLHIDLAARNILLTEKMTINISDFGMSRQLYESEEYNKQGMDAIPIRWTAPECLPFSDRIVQRRYTTKSDVWSYGIILFEIFTFGDLPYATKSNDEIAGFLQTGRLEKPDYATEDIYNQMLGCWNIDPDLRPTFSEVENQFHRFLNE